MKTKKYMYTYEYLIYIICVVRFKSHCHYFFSSACGNTVADFLCHNLRLDLYLLIRQRDLWYDMYYKIGFFCCGRNYYYDYATFMIKM